MYSHELQLASLSLLADSERQAWLRLPEDWRATFVVVWQTSRDGPCTISVQFVFKNSDGGRNKIKSDTDDGWGGRGFRSQAFDQRGAQYAQWPQSITLKFASQISAPGGPRCLLKIAKHLWNTPNTQRWTLSKLMSWFVNFYLGKLPNCLQLVAVASAATNRDTSVSRSPDHRSRGQSKKRNWIYLQKKVKRLPVLPTIQAFS